MNLVGRFITVALLPLAAIRAAERDIVRTFPVGPDCRVAIETFGGAITVTESDVPQVRVAVHLEIGADTDAEAEQLLSHLRLSFDERANHISVTARDPAQTGARFDWNERKQIEPTFRVTVPRRCDLDLRTRRGTIIVGNVTGRLLAHAEVGDVFFRHVGGSADASTDEGDVVVSQCDGSVVAQSRRGVVRLGVIQGACEVHDTNGGIEIMEAKGALTAFGEAASVTVGIPKDFAGGAEIKTSGGSVVLKIDPAANCEIDATASWLGHVGCRLPVKVIAGGSSRRKLDGRLNRGGPRIVAYAGGGDVTIVPGDSPFE